MVARPAAVQLVVQQHGALLVEVSAQRQHLDARGGGALLLGAPGLPVAQQDTRGAARGGEGRAPPRRTEAKSGRAGIHAGHPPARRRATLSE
jgi:hypothetical protein